MRLEQITEVRYANPKTLEVFGVLYVNPDQLGDELGYRVPYRDVKQPGVKIWLDIEKQVDEWMEAIVYYATVSKVKAPQDSLALKVVKKGSGVVYQRDKHGWILTDDQQVWALQPQ